MEEKIVICIIENNKKELLLQKKTWDYPFYPGMWCFSGGKAESEDLNKEIKRELKEEIGIKLKPKFLFNQKIILANHRLIFYVFFAKLNDISKVKIGEGAGIAFFGKEELKNLNFNPINKKILNRYFKEF